MGGVVGDITVVVVVDIMVAIIVGYNGSWSGGGYKGSYGVHIER